MPGRSSNSAGARFGYNGQMKDNDIAGVGNHNTALFWEYDTRTGRRWNVDPLAGAPHNISLSSYSAFANNPIVNIDPTGADWYSDKNKSFAYDPDLNENNATQFFKDNNVEGGTYFGVSGTDKVESLDSKGRMTGTVSNISLNSNGSITDLVTGKDFSPGQRFTNAMGATFTSYKDPTTDLLSWNGPIARALIPDYLTFGLNIQVSSVSYLNEEGALTLLLRGKDPGLYWNTSTGASIATSIGLDGGVSIGKGGYCLGNPQHLSSSMLGGWQVSGSVVVGIKAVAGGSVNVGADVGFDDNGKPATITEKVGGSVGVGVSTPIQGSIGGVPMRNC